MAQNNGELLKRLRATFRVEADEHLRAILSGLRALEREAAPVRRAAVIESVFRETHSLKGAARAVNLPVVESLCQPMESAFAALKQGRLQASPGLLETLREAADAIQALVAGPDMATDSREATMALARRLEAALGAAPAVDSGAVAAPPAGPPPEAPASGDAPLPQTVRIGTARLDAMMRHVEELLQPRLAVAQRLAEAEAAAAELASWRKRRLQLQPVLRALDADGAQEAAAAVHAGGSVSAVLEYLDAEQVHLKALDDRMARLQRAMRRDQRSLGVMTEALHRDAREMQLLPFAWLADGLSRVVGGLAREQAKEVDLVLEGGDIEIDRRILEEMKAPLIHLLRNGVDHGIETPAERVAVGKPRRGTITLAVSHGDSGRVGLRVADDGAGIDADKVKAAARRLGVAAAEDRAGEHDTRSLVFRSGVSTSAIITDVSGRGLGLAIVREKVERLGGSVAVDSDLGKGTRFQIDLPLTVALFRGLLLRAGDLLCVVPAASVERVLRADIATVKTVKNCETLELAGQAVSLVRLAAVLERPGPAEAPEQGRVLAAVVQHAARRVAFQVEAVLGEQEVLVKPLGPQLARVRNVAGACMLGSGETVPVLSVPDLLKSASRHGTAAVARPAPKPVAAERQSILVAEDSVTSRSLLKGILEAAGYRVSTAVDGADAYTTLKTADFDLLVSDVEMPRMDGFELTARVRADRGLSELPVVLVTALASREHRERGIDVGANAYIVKSDFDQSNLLEVIQRLVGTDRRDAE